MQACNQGHVGNLEGTYEHLLMLAPSTTGGLNNQDENVTACSQCNSATFPFQIELGGRVNVVDQQALASETVMIRLLVHLWRWVGGWSV